MEEPVQEPVVTAVAPTTSDGVALQGDLVVPADVRAAAIVCHPHPQYGGSRHDHVVGALFDALPTVGVAALRFDFRADYDEGRGERLDAAAALAELRGRWPGLPLLATGYSFGAIMALAQPASQVPDPSIAGWVGVAPPLAAMPTPAPPAGPTLLVVPAHDQFSPPEATQPIVEGWPAVSVETIAMADHFLQGRTSVVADVVTAWVDDLLSRR